MAVDGTDPDLIETIMASDLDAVEARHAEGKALFDNIGRFAPAFGMIGTLIGLVIMLQHMEDPSKIGPAMAVALLTTLYGAAFANMLCLPLADKLNAKHEEEMHTLEIAKAGILGLQAGDNPRILEMKLAVFLAPKLRLKLEAASAG